MTYLETRKTDLDLFRQWKLASKEGRTADAAATRAKIHELRKPSRDYHAGGYKAYLNDREIKVIDQFPTRKAFEAHRRKQIAEDPFGEVMRLRFEAHRQSGCARLRSEFQSLGITLDFGNGYANSNAPAPRRPNTLRDFIAALLAA